MIIAPLLSLEKDVIEADAFVLDMRGPNMHTVLRTRLVKDVLNQVTRLTVVKAYNVLTVAK